MEQPPARDLTLTPERVAEEREWVLDRADVAVPLANDVRAQLADAFDTGVDEIAPEGYERVVVETFADGDRAVNVAALVAMLRTVDVPDDYPGFVVDEWLGRELAATIAGEQPLRLLAEATFHYADVHYHGPERSDDERHGSGQSGDGERHSSGQSGDGDLHGSERSGDGNHSGSEQSGDGDRSGSERSENGSDRGGRGRSGAGEGAGLDDLDAALAAGVQTRLPGWDWQADESPFAVDPE